MVRVEAFSGEGLRQFVVRVEAISGKGWGNLW